MKRIITHFTEEELLELQHYNWKKLLQEAKHLSRRLNGCENCQKLDPLLFFHLSNTYKKKVYDYFGVFCSVSCFQEWRQSGKDLYPRVFNEKNLHLKILHELADYTPKELRGAKNFNFQKAIRLRLKDRKLCDFCHIKAREGYLLYAHKRGKPKPFIDDGDYCSSKCMLRALKQKVRREN